MQQRTRFADGIVNADGDRGVQLGAEHDVVCRDLETVRGDEHFPKGGFHGVLYTARRVVPCALDALTLNCRTRALSGVCGRPDFARLLSPLGHASCSTDPKGYGRGAPGWRGAGKMLHSLTALRKFHVHASDGDIGEVTDGYFDDERWVVRYLVVNTVSWLNGREVLISPYSIFRVDDAESAIVTQLTRKQVEGSPSIDTARPISRRQEESYLSYFGYPVYWPYTTLWAWGATPVVIPPEPRLQPATRPPSQVAGGRPASAVGEAPGTSSDTATGPAGATTSAEAGDNSHLRSGRE